MFLVRDVHAADHDGAGEVQGLGHGLRTEEPQDDVLDHGADADGGDEDLRLEIAGRQHGPRREMIDATPIAPQTIIAARMASGAGKPRDDMV